MTVNINNKIIESFNFRSDGKFEYKDSHGDKKTTSAAWINGNAAARTKALKIIFQNEPNAPALVSNMVSKLGQPLAGGKAGREIGLLNGTLVSQSDGSWKVEKIKVAEKAPTSSFRHIFQGTAEMKTEFANFLKTIFYQLDEKKVFAVMEDLLSDPTKTDEEVYNGILKQINSTRKPGSMFSQLWSLFVVQKGMGKQVAELTKDVRKEAFQDYTELSNRRYLTSIRKIAGLPLNGKTRALCDTVDVGFKDKIEAGAIFSAYPYQKSMSINDADCKDFMVETEKTYKPIGDEIENSSMDMISCLGGLHHTPEDRLEPFIKSVYAKLKPGATLLLREHDAVPTEENDIAHMASVVHTFVNASDGVEWKAEAKEIRGFKSTDEWTRLLKRHGFTRIAKENLILKDDPTHNAMMGFVKNPVTAAEVESAASYQKDYVRAKEGSRATWIEWGNVRFSKQYAEYTENHHSYAFDFIGHLRQHWQHFYNYAKESFADPKASLKDVIFSDNMVMNLFILLGTSAQLSVSAALSLPSALVARVRHGEGWREVCNLTALEKFEAEMSKDYSTFIDYDPFFKYPYLSKIKEMWQVVLSADEGIFTKVTSIVGASFSTVGLAAQGLSSAFINSMYYGEDASPVKPEAIQVLIEDPSNELDGVIARWNEDKMKVEYQGKKPYENHNIEVIHSAKGTKLVSIPFYKPFGQICGYLSEASSKEGSKIKLVKVGGQEEITVDLLLEEGEKAPVVAGSRLIYEMERLQDPSKRHYATYEVGVKALQEFGMNALIKGKIAYIHEHR